METKLTKKIWMNDELYEQYISELLEWDNDFSDENDYDYYEDDDQLFS